VKFMRSVSVLSSGSEGEQEVLKRQLSLRASQRLSAKRRGEKVSTLLTSSFCTSNKYCIIQVILIIYFFIVSIITSLTQVL